MIPLSKVKTTNQQQQQQEQEQVKVKESTRMGLRMCEEEVSSSFLPETLDRFLKHVSMISDVSHRHDKCHDFVARLEAEFSYLQLFHAHLPLSMPLLNDVIQFLKKETSKYTTSRDGCQPVAVLEEFIPLKKESDVENKEIVKKVDDASVEGEDFRRDKKTWMSSVQLWNADHLPSTCNATAHTAIIPPKKRDTHTLSSVGGISLRTPEKEDEDANDVPGGISIHKAHSSSLVSTARKQRRCWSAELHRRFVDALTQLGGPQVATPKQIRELMGVDGLTNDEVKSHLQKYRLHTRRIPTNKSAAMSPQGPLQLSVSTTAADSMEDEEEEEDDDKSQTH